MSKSKEPKIKKVWVRYADRCRKGEKIMVMANRDMSWSDVRKASNNVVREMLAIGWLTRLDADLFGDSAYGQTIGLGSAA